MLSTVSFHISDQFQIAGLSMRGSGFGYNLLSGAVSEVFVQVLGFQGVEVQEERTVSTVVHSSGSYRRYLSGSAVSMSGIRGFPPLHIRNNPSVTLAKEAFRGNIRYQTDGFPVRFRSN